MDDIIVTGNNSVQVDHFISTLSQAFELKDLGPLNYFLGIDQITRTKFGLSLTQAKFASNIHYRFNMENSKPTKTPSCPSTKLVPHEGVALSNPSVYRSMVGALQYLTFTLPNISFSVHQLCQFMSNQTSTHLEAAKHVLHYVRGTVSRSSIEAEYRTLATTTAELSWLCILFKELKVFLSHVPVLWCDNVSAITLSVNPVFHSRTKDLEVDYHFVHEKVLRKDLNVGFVSSKDNLADIFTKPLSAPLFLLLRCKLLVDSSPFCLRGDVEDR